MYYCPFDAHVCVCVRRRYNRSNTINKRAFRKCNCVAQICSSIVEPVPVGCNFSVYTSLLAPIETSVIFSILITNDNCVGRFTRNSKGDIFHFILLRNANIFANNTTVCMFRCINRIYTYIYIYKT